MVEIVKQPEEGALTAADLALIAAQLACPTGEVGIKAGRNMAVNNASMTTATFEYAALDLAQRVLEIGFGNGQHVAEWLRACPGLHYTGLEKSALMLAEARQLNLDWLSQNRMALLAAPEAGMPFADAVFDVIIGINAVYFWPDLVTYLQELYRILNNEGRVLITMGDKSFMQSLPFTEFGFCLYDLDELEAYLKQAGFGQVNVHSHTETVMSKANTMVERLYHVVCASK